MFSGSFRRDRCGLVGLVASSLLILTVVVTDVQAKRGCFAYGHSCLGGLGKRADHSEPTMDVSDGAQAAFDGQGGVQTAMEAREDAGRAVGADVMRTARFGVPREGVPWNWAADNEETAVGRQWQKLTPQQMYQMSPVLRQMLRNMRANQELNMPDL